MLLTVLLDISLLAFLLILQLPSCPSLQETEWPPLSLWEGAGEEGCGISGISLHAYWGRGEDVGLQDWWGFIRKISYVLASL